jgi:hypothetical protein
MKSLISIFGIILTIPINSLSQCGSGHQGFYTIYEANTYQTNFEQTVPSSGFSEDFTAEVYSFPNVKLGYSFTAWGNAGTFGEWAVWGIDLGAGISYNKSIVNAYPIDMPGYLINDAFSLETGYQNGQVLFNYYQPGNMCSIDDYGLNFHIDAGTIWYIGAELDAGPSRIRFTDTYNIDQRVKGLGWFATGRLHTGISIPLPFWYCDSDFSINFKAYVTALGWSARSYKLDWLAEDKKLRNFTTLQGQGTAVSGCGFSLTFLF